MSESLNKTSQKDQITEDKQNDDLEINEVIALSDETEEDLSFLYDDDEDDKKEGWTR